MTTQRALTEDGLTQLEDFLRRAWQSLERGDLEAIDRICAQALAGFPDDFQLLSLRSTVEIKQGRFLAATRSVERMLQLRPDDLDTLKQRSYLQQVIEESRQHPYARRYFEKRAIYLDYPRTISIETIGRCNAKCNFCPAPELERRTETMPDDLFAKIIRDIQEIPAGVPINIIPNLVNEPFMDKKMFGRLRQINEALPTARIQIYSNFGVLPKDFMAEFREIRNLGNLNISFHAANRADYESIMHIDFDRTVRHLKTFMRSNREDRFLVTARYSFPRRRQHSGRCGLRGAVPGHLLGVQGRRGLCAVTLPYSISLTSDETGNIYCAWHDGRNNPYYPDVYFNSSSDYGNTWGISDIRINTGIAGATYSIWPEVACDDSGHVYVAWYDRRNGVGDIYVNFSSDYGVNWQTSDLRLDTDSPEIVDSGYPNISTDNSGHIYIIWTDNQEDVGGPGLYLNYSLDHGATWLSENMKVGSGGFHPQIVTHGGHAYVIRDNSDIVFTGLFPLLPTYPSPADGITNVNLTALATYVIVIVKRGT